MTDLELLHDRRHECCKFLFNNRSNKVLIRLVVAFVLPCLFFLAFDMLSVLVIGTQLYSHYQLLSDTLSSYERAHFEYAEPCVVRWIYAAACFEKAFLFLAS
jgi:hypothetical protein